MPKKEIETNYDQLPPDAKENDIFKLKGITVTVKKVKHKNQHSAKIVVYQYETPKLEGDSPTPI